MAPNVKPLTDRDVETLRDLEAACRNYLDVTGQEFVQPMDCGGWNGSHHSATLAKLAKRNLVERKQRGGWSRGSWKYRITQAGREAIAAHSS
jgi:hypothetical protein